MNIMANYPYTVKISSPALLGEEMTNAIAEANDWVFEQGYEVLSVTPTVTQHRFPGKDDGPYMTDAYFIVSINITMVLRPQQ